GNRQNKSRARMKYVIRKLGWDGYRTEFEKRLAAVAQPIQPIDPEAAEPLARPPVRLRLSAADPAPGFEHWRKTNVAAQKQKGFAAVTVRLVRGDITAAQLRGVADLARRLGDGTARLTIDQNLLLRFVADDRVAELHRALVGLGLAAADAGTIVDVT